MLERILQWPAWRRGHQQGKCPWGRGGQQQRPSGPLKQSILTPKPQHRGKQLSASALGTAGWLMLGYVVTAIQDWTG